MASNPPTAKRVVLVTGANKGIGKEIARKLGSLEDHIVLVGSRDKQLGARAAAELEAAGCDAVPIWLDLTDATSMEAARDFIQREFGRLDVLVNNAAICFNDPTLYGKVEFTPFEQQANITVQTNYFGTLAVTQAMLPLLRASKSSPRIVIVASSAGRLRGSQAIQDALTSPTLDVPQLSSLMQDFVQAAEAGVQAEKGWPNTCYGVSKLGLIALTRVLAREEPTVMVNAADPGYCATDQNNNQGYISAAEGAITPAALAYQQIGDESTVSGKLFYNLREIPWSYQ